VHQGSVRSSDCRVVHSHCYHTSLRFLINRGLLVVLKQVEEDLVCLEAACLSTVRPVATLIDNLFAFLDEDASHIHQLGAGEFSHSVPNLTRLIRETSHLKHLECLRWYTCAAEARVIERDRHVVIPLHGSNTLRDLAFRSTDSVVLILRFVSQ